jgi:hypothetical protein
MNLPYLLDTELIRQYEDISVNLKPQRLNVFIRKAQELDLKPFLGHAFYYELLSCFSADRTITEDAPQPYRDLYNGCTYTDQSGHPVNHAGITPALVYFTLARFIEADAVHYTATGPVIKQQHDTASLKPADLVKLVQQQRSVANAYLRDVEKYLQDNRQHFPLWHYNEKNASARQPGPRIRGIDKTDYNYPDGGAHYSPFRLNQLL